MQGWGESWGKKWGQTVKSDKKRKATSGQTRTRYIDINIYDINI